MIHKTLHRELKSEQQELHKKNGGWAQLLRKGNLFLLQ